MAKDTNLAERKKVDFCFYLVLILVFVLFIAFSSRIPYPSNLFPIVLSALGIVFTIAVVCQSFFLRKATERHEKDKEHQSKDIFPLFLLGMIILFVVLFYLTGPFPSIAIFSIIVMRYLSISWKKTVVAVFFFILGYYLMFVLLKVRIHFGLIEKLF